MKPSPYAFNSIEANFNFQVDKDMLTVKKAES